MKSFKNHLCTQKVAKMSQDPTNSLVSRNPLEVLLQKTAMWKLHFYPVSGIMLFMVDSDKGFEQAGLVRSLP